MQLAAMSIFITNKNLPITKIKKNKKNHVGNSPDRRGGVQLLYLAAMPTFITNSRMQLRVKIGLVFNMPCRVKAASDVLIVRAYVLLVCWNKQGDAVTF